MNTHPDASNLTNMGKGRPKGAKNKVTRDVKETFAKVFSDFQDNKKASLDTWGQENLTNFYTLASKLIPSKTDIELTQKDGLTPIERAARIIEILESATAERARQAIEREAVGAIAGPSNGGVPQ